jgi:hypothetical protein
VLQAVVYREGTAHVDVRLGSGAWFGEVRVWRGARWPAIEKRWRGRVKGWIPWYSLEDQAIKAVRYVTHRATLARLTVKEVQAAIERLKRGVG